MKTKDFRTKHEFHHRANPRGTRDYIIGLDAGYSGMKVFYESGYFCFPSFVKKITTDTLNIPDEKDIIYKDLKTNEEYMVGYSAQEMLESADTNDTEGEMFSRKRYGKKAFQILCNTAIGIACMNKTDPREVFIQTGLPSSYVKGDSNALIKALSTPADYAIKIGSGKWYKLHQEVKRDHIHIIPQPMGSMYSTVILNDGRFTDNAFKFLQSNVLVVDIGFGTCDFYGTKNRQVVCTESIDEIGMLQVMKKMSKLILEECDEDIRVPALQHILETGIVTCVNEDEMTQEDREVSELLEKASKEVFKEAMEKSKSITNAFRDYQYLVVTGGTGAAWFDMIKDYLKGMKHLQVIPGNINDTIPVLYANARGYYLFRYSSSRRRG